MCLKVRLGASSSYDGEGEVANLSGRMGPDTQQEFELVARGKDRTEN